MSKLNHLRTVIRMMEDELLRSKDTYEIDKISRALRKKRVELQKLEWKEMNARAYY